MPKSKKAAAKRIVRRPAAKANSRKTAAKSKSRPIARKGLAKRSAVTSKSRKSQAKKTKPVKRATGARTRKTKRSTATPVAKRSAALEPAASPKAMRLTFSYQGDQVKLISQEPVEMTLPASDSLRGYANEKGFWAELKGDQDKTLFRRVLHNPTRNDAEVFSDDPEQSISRAAAPKRKGVFTVVVPHTEKGREVTLSRSSERPDLAGAPRGMTALRSLATGPAREIARFKLRK